MSSETWETCQGEGPLHRGVEARNYLSFTMSISVDPSPLQLSRSLSLWASHTSPATHVMVICASNCTLPALQCTQNVKQLILGTFKALINTVCKTTWWLTLFYQESVHQVLPIWQSLGLKTDETAREINRELLVSHKPVALIEGPTNFVVNMCFFDVSGFKNISCWTRPGCIVSWSF